MGVFSGVVAANMVVVMGTAKKPDGGVIYLPFVMPEKVVGYNREKIPFGLRRGGLRTGEEEIVEEEGLLKFLRERCDDLRRKRARHRVLIRDMEALGDRGMAVDSLESLKQTHARETTKLAGLTDVMAETLAGIHEKEGHVARLDLND
uniref:Glycoside hydrolase, family 79 n=1 Tax=Tanacetum cinerariifolium TaxID=118510 RepID=A0A6L2LMT1_TANCI|nr:glycoside hydrolase, family 79 [Tanacetum cinerariifolium]